MKDPRRQLRLSLRRQLSVMRRFDVEYVGGSSVRYTCRTCGTVKEEEMRIGPNRGKGPGSQILDPKHVQKFVRYWQAAGSVSGSCEHCLKVLRDERYPLTPKENERGK